MEKIEEMLKQLTPIKEKPEVFGLKVLESSILVNTSETESITSNETYSSDISKIEKAFNSLEIYNDFKLNRLRNKVNPTSLTKNWHPKPTPPDIQFEERNYQSQFSVSSDKLYDGILMAFPNKKS